MARVAHFPRFRVEQDDFRKNSAEGSQHSASRHDNKKQTRLDALTSISLIGSHVTVREVQDNGGSDPFRKE